MKGEREKKMCDGEGSARQEGKRETRGQWKERGSGGRGEEGDATKEFKGLSHNNVTIYWSSLVVP